MNRLLVIGCIAFFFACKSGNKKEISRVTTYKKGSPLRVLTYGLAGSQAGTANAVIAKQYGFCYYPVTGCVVTKALIDSIDKENNSVYQALVDQYGADWKQQYAKKVDSLTALLEQVKAIVSSHPLLKQISRQHNGDVYYHITPADTANIFYAQAFSSDTNNSSYTFKVNLTNHRVERVK